MISLQDIEEQDDDDSLNEGVGVGGRFRSNLLEDSIVLPGSSLDSLSAMNDDGEVTAAGTGTATPQQQQPSAKSQELEQKYLFALETVRQLRHRLIRRTSVIEEIRKYYLRDVITMKHVLKDVLNGTERDIVWKQYEANLPSLDLKMALTLHAPGKCEFQVKPCELCGGELELVMKDTDEVDYLKKTIKEGKDREARWREKLAFLDVQVENSNREKAESTKSHMEEKRVLYAEMKKMKDEMDRVKNENCAMIRGNKKMKEEHDDFMSKNADLFLATAKLAQAEKELDVLKVNMEETQEALRITRSNEKTQQRELNTTKAEVKDLKITIEKSKFDINNMVQDKQQLTNHLEKVKEAYEAAEKNLESTNQLNFDYMKRIRELEEELKNISKGHENEKLEIIKSFETLKGELTDLQQTKKSQEDEKVKLESALTVAQTEIHNLQEKSKTQAIELFECAEEIEQFEEEIASMQQFIRDSLGHGDSDSDGGDTEGEDGEKKSHHQESSKLSGFRNAVTGNAASIKQKREQRKQYRRDTTTLSDSVSVSQEEALESAVATASASTDAAPVVVGERKAGLPYSPKRKATMKRSMIRAKAETPTLGLPIDPDDMVIVNQPQRLEGLSDEKTIAATKSIMRRRSVPKLYVFRGPSTKEQQPGDDSQDTLKSNKARLEEVRQLFDRPLVATSQNSFESSVVTSTKVKFKVKDASKDKEAPIQVDAPPDGATTLELWFRFKLLETIKSSKYYSDNACNRMLNLVSPLVHSVCLMVDNACSALWDGLQLGKRGLDFFQKMQVVCEGIMACGQDGITNSDVAETCAVVVPIAGASYNSNLTAQWQEKAEVKDDIIYDLMPMIINYETGERRVRPYSEFFAPPQEKDPNFHARVDLAADSIRKMSDHSVGMNAKLSEYLVEVLREWSSAKSVFIDLEARIEAEKDKIRRAMEAKVSALGKELSRQQALHEKNQEKIRGLEKKMQDYAKMEVLYQACEEKLAATEVQLKEKCDQLVELKASLQDAVLLGKEKDKEIVRLLEIIEQLRREATDLQTELGAAQKLSEEVSVALQAMTDEKEDYKLKLEEMLAKEDARLNQLIHVEIQYEPYVCEVEVQTEFIVPPMELKTVVANKLAKSGMKKYPMVFSQSLDYVPADDGSVSNGGVPAESSRPESGAGSSRVPSRGASRGASRSATSRTNLSSISNIPVKDGSTVHVRETIEDFFDLQDTKLRDARENPEQRDLFYKESKTLHNENASRHIPTNNVGNLLTQFQHQNSDNGSHQINAPLQSKPHGMIQTNSQYPFINPLTTGLLSRDTLTFNISDFRASPPVIGYDRDISTFDRDAYNKVEQLPSRQSAYDEHARQNSNAGLGKIGIALPLLQNFPTTSTVDLHSPRSVNSKDSLSSGISTTNKGLKKGVNSKVRRVDKDSDPSVEETPFLEVPFQSYKSPSRDFEFSENSSAVTSAIDGRHPGSLRNNVSNAHQEIVNGIVYNYKSGSENPVFKTESGKIDKDQEIAELREPITIKSYSSKVSAQISATSNIFASSLPKPRQATTPPHTQKLVRGKTPMVIDDNILDTPKQPPANRPLMSSSLSQAGLSTLSSDTMKKMQKELLHR